MLEQNQKSVHWIHISSNANIFEYDYEGMKLSNSCLKKELLQKVL